MIAEICRPTREMYVVGRGGALVEKMTINRNIVGSTPALATT